MPVSRFPVELLARIFVYCLPQEPYLAPNVSEPPLLLMRICRQWRNVALHTTELWDSLDAVEDDGWGVELPPMREECMEGYATWLSRSGNRPLSIAIPFDSQGQCREEWLRIILSHGTRLRRVRVVDEEGFDLNALLDGAHGLHFLAVEARHDGNRNLAVTHAQPYLHALILDGLHARPATLPSHTWVNLTHLAVKLPLEESYELDEFLALVMRCPNVQKLIFGLLKPAPVDTDPPPPLHIHPNLRSLAVILDEALEDEAHPSCVLKLPGLCSLRVQTDFRFDLEMELTEDSTPVGLDAFQHSCNVNLESDLAFRLFDAGWEGLSNLKVNFTGGLDVFSTVLELCPNLKVLTVIGVRCAPFSQHVAHSALHELYVKLDGPLGNVFQAVTLPGLRHMCIIAADCGRHDDVCEFVCRSGCPLESLVVWTGRSSTAWTSEERSSLTMLAPTLTEVNLRPFVL